VSRVQSRSWLTIEKIQTKILNASLKNYTNNKSLTFFFFFVWADLVKNYTNNKSLTFFFFFVWADLVVRCKVLLFEASPQCHYREPPNQVSIWRVVTGDRKLVCDRPFAPLLRICSSPRACTKPHLCIVERNSPTLVRRRFNLTQEGLCRVIPGGEGPGDGINVWR